VFTTHTPVPAGHDAFPFTLVGKYLATYWRTLGLDRDRFLALGAHDAGARSAVHMSALALRLSGPPSAGSPRAADGSRRMWAPLWPGTPEEHVPIVAVTNGVHVPSWVAPEIDALLRAHVDPSWLGRHDDEALWERVDRIPDRALWEAHRRLKFRLHRF